ncbi:MAG: AzlD domain-containing protein [Holophagales bacterium]|nr:AzlD domain-containing protein [Holophagales bacterium]
MTHESLALWAIALMGAVTFLTRAGGYVLIRCTAPGPRLERFLSAAPKTLFAALSTAALLRGSWPEWIAASITLAVMATSRHLLLALLAGVGSVALLRLV